jgi:hypothetical protein
VQKKKTKRNTVKNAIINPNYNLKSRSEELGDISEYFNTLPPEEKAWMLKYSENVINAGFDREVDKNNLISNSYTKDLILSYVTNVTKFKNKNLDKNVVRFITKYLIRNDNIPLKIIQDIFFENDKKKLTKLISNLKESLCTNIKKVKKREVNQIIKIMEKEIYNTNNARNRCIMTKEKAAGSLSYINDMSEDEISYNYEDVLVAKIDKQNELAKESDYLNDGNSKNRKTSNSSK